MGGLFQDQAFNREGIREVERKVELMSRKLNRRTENYDLLLIVDL